MAKYKFYKPRLPTKLARKLNTDPKLFLGTFNQNLI